MSGGVHHFHIWFNVTIIFCSEKIKMLKLRNKTENKILQVDLFHTSYLQGNDLSMSHVLAYLVFLKSPLSKFCFLL